MILAIDDFTELFLVSLANINTSFKIKNIEYKACIIPFDYLNIIESILCEKNDWTEKFFNLINMKDYFNNHFKWEDKLSYLIDNYIKDHKKDINISIKDNSFYILFTIDEIEKINKKYDKKRVDEIIHFVSLLKSNWYSRPLQEKMEIDTRLRDKLLYDEEEKNRKVKRFLNIKYK